MALNVLDQGRSFQGRYVGTSYKVWGMISHQSFNQFGELLCFLGDILGPQILSLWMTGLPTWFQRQAPRVDLPMFNVEDRTEIALDMAIYLESLAGG